MPAGDGGIDRGQGKGDSSFIQPGVVELRQVKRREGEISGAGLSWWVTPLPPAALVTLVELFDPLILFPREQINLMIRFIYFLFSLRDMGVSCTVSPWAFSEWYGSNIRVRIASELNRKASTSMRRQALSFVLVACSQLSPSSPSLTDVSI